MKKTKFYMGLLSILVVVFYFSMQSVQVEAAKKTYSITYRLNGGKNNSQNPTKYSGKKTITLKKPTRSGYRFLGWYKDAACTKKVTAIKKGSKGKKTFYAKWDKQYLVVIDAGHQQKGDSSLEPIGPGATTKKAKVASGTQGVATGIPEYKLNLSVAFKLKSQLEKRGYKVYMVRKSHNVNLSNAKRAEIANKKKADAFIRIHANGDANSSVNGIITICQTKKNPYNAKLYKKSKKLSEQVLKGMVKSTGAKNRGVWETDSMSGINWCKVPVTIVEMGYMSNPTEDKKMAQTAYQKKIAKGIADGIDAYFGK